MSHVLVCVCVCVDCVHCLILPCMAYAKYNRYYILSHNKVNDVYRCQKGRLKQTFEMICFVAENKWFTDDRCNSNGPLYNTNTL